GARMPVPDGQRSNSCSRPSARQRQTRKQILQLLARHNRALLEFHRFELRRDLRAFVRHFWPILEPATPLQWNWHLDLLCEHLALVANGECRRLIINVPPRSMKSLLCTVFYPVWRWISAPQRRFMFVSYSEELSTDHSVFRRNVLNSERYRELWGSGVCPARDQNVKTQYENTHRGVMFATSITGSATGKGCDELIV